MLFSDVEKVGIINQTPKLEKYFKKVVGSQELIKGIERFCLWIEDSDLKEIQDLQIIQNILSNVKEFRLKSKRQATIDASMTPHRFGEARYTQVT